MENQSSGEVNNSNQKVGVVKQFYEDTVQILTEPVAFYRTRFDQMSMNQTLVYGLMISWFAAFIDWITRAVKHETLFDGFMKVKNQLQALPIWKDLPADIWAQGDQMNAMMPAWGFEGLRMLINPFHSLLSFIIYGAIFWLGATILVSRENPGKKSVTIQNVIKITAVASASSMIGSVLSFLPIGLGSFIGWLYYTALLMLGFSEKFQISRMRGLGIVFLPTLFTVLVASCLLGLIIAVFAGLLSTLFH